MKKDWLYQFLSSCVRAFRDEESEARVENMRSRRCALPAWKGDEEMLSSSSAPMLAWAAAGQPFVTLAGQPTRRVHVHGRPTEALSPGYQAMGES